MLTAERRRRGRRNGGNRPSHAPVDPPQDGQEGDQARQQGGREALKASGLANSKAISHEESKVEAGNVNEYPLGDIFMVAQMGASHAAGFKGMSEGAFDKLTPKTHQALAMLAIFADAVGADGIALGLLAISFDSTAREPQPATVRARPPPALPPPPLPNAACEPHRNSS